MIKVENLNVWGFEHAIRGMRNPLNSWDKSDSIKCYANRNCSGICNNNKCGLCIGSNDLDLMKRLYKAGTEHRKYLRQIVVSMDITAPLYWWKEFDTYTVGVTKNSCSTMHKIAAKPFEWEDFSVEHMLGDAEGMNGIHVTKIVMRHVMETLNYYRDLYNKTKNKEYWWQLIQLLPSSYNQRRTVSMNYENVVTIIKQRSGHKLDEWNDLIKVLKELPYIVEITGG